MNPRIFQLKITLRGGKPPIWRRVQVFEDITLSRLHDVIQIAMGWYDSHLHEFHIHGTEYGAPNPELDFGEPRLDERKFALNDLVSNVRTKFQYVYDFGDTWIHDIVFERTFPAGPEVSYPVCVAGRRNCPPEDVGGIGGYADFLEAISDPANERHEELLEWSGTFDPEEFSLEQVNTRLRDTFRPRKKRTKRLN